MICTASSHDIALILVPSEEECWTLRFPSIGTEADDAITAADSTWAHVANFMVTIWPMAIKVLDYP
jgi:hypothetical protein